MLQVNLSNIRILFFVLYVDIIFKEIDFSSVLFFLSSIF